MSENVKVTKGFKVSPDFRAKLGDLAEGFSTEEAFLEKMVEIYEMDILKQGNAGYRKQIEELEMHTKRINSLFTSMIEAENAEKQMLRQQHEEHQLELVAHGQRFVVEVDVLNRKLQGNNEFLDELKVKIEEMKTQINDLNGVVADNEKTIAEKDGLIKDYKEKNGKLAMLVADSQETVQRYELLKAEFTAYQADAKQQIDDWNHKFMEQKNEMIKLSNHYANQEKSLQLDLQTAVTKTQFEYQTKIEALHGKFNDEIVSLINEKQSLLDQISQLKDQLRQDK